MRPLLLFLMTGALFAETGHDAWLRYAPVKDIALPAVVVMQGNSPVLTTAREELIRGVRGMLGRTLRVQKETSESAIVLGVAADLPAEGYRIRHERGNIAIQGGTDRGTLYGVFAVLRKIALQQPLGEDRQEPHAPIRWVNEWDNLDGTIERGYGGRSIFFEGNNVRQDLGPVRDYARLLASLGINGIAINNVNANPRVITPEFLPQVARIAGIMRAWGIRVAVSVDFASPQKAGGLPTFDPLDPAVIEWWKKKVDEIYTAIPDLGGFVLKADSEGRVGPSAYGRTHADAANVIARALKPHGGVIFYRGFVYDHHMDWNNPKNDRARAAYDNFVALDGKFDDNVLIQIKHGPIDFQVREPASPLFGALEKTKRAIELQITQEYFGQARHNVFLVPMWKEALDFNLITPVKTLVNGFVGVSNVGLDTNWFGNHLSQSNLYGFGRLAWNPNLTSEQIVEEWTRQTFSPDPAVVKTIDAMLLQSWRVYENYTGPLGLQTLTDIVGNHFGVAVEASERNGWGQWHRADEQGVGLDRTVATGTGYIGQYKPAVAKMYESLATCPDDLLLFMHHVPYRHVLHSGKTVIQTIYDLHYEGAQAVADWVKQWKTLEGKVDEPRYVDVLQQLEFQAGNAELWRDAVNTWFLRTSGIADTRGRAGKFPGRYEAERMELTGFAPVDVKPWEAASDSQAANCASVPCSAKMRFDGAPGWYTMRVRYFDWNGGAARYRLQVNGQTVDEWTANDKLPAKKIDSSSSSRRTVTGIALRSGDEIRLEGTPDGTETAAFDYIEIVK